VSDKLYAALQVCLTALEHGDDLETALAMFPDLEVELRPALEAAEKALEAGRFNIPYEIVQNSQTRLMGHAAQLREKPPIKGWFGIPRVVTAVLIALFIVLAGGAGLVTVSAQALPGDPLYAMKRTVEKVGLTLAFNENAKQSLQTTYSQRRKDETRELLKLDRSERVSFEGDVDAINSDIWTIDGIHVQITPTTEISGLIEPGMGVEVDGDVKSGGWIQAYTIKLRRYELFGSLEHIQEHAWVVDGTRFLINKFTFIEEDIEIGDSVVVLLQVKDNGELTAVSIHESEESSGSAESSTDEDVDDTEEDDAEEISISEPTHEREKPEVTEIHESEESEEKEDSLETHETEDPDESEHNSQSDD
jgi:hypothetical protein